MAIKLKDFAKNFEREMNKALEKATGKQVLEEGKDLVVSDIKKRVTLGYGVERTGGTKKRFDRLSSSYVTQRRRDKKKGKLGKNATPKKSNLHKSGKMIEEDLDGVVDGKTIIIGMQTDRSAKIAAFVEKKRPFLNLSKGEVKRITKFFQSQITEIFRKALKSLG